jgi:hypothetical protein
MKQVFTFFLNVVKWIGGKIGAVITTILLMVVYCTIFALTAIILKLSGKRLLPGYKKGIQSYWVPKEKIEPTMDFMRRQF